MENKQWEHTKYDFKKTYSRLLNIDKRCSESLTSLCSVAFSSLFFRDDKV